MLTRGVLIDVAGLKNVKMLTRDLHRHREDLQQALAEGEIVAADWGRVMIHTGWGQLYNEKDKAAI